MPPTRHYTCFILIFLFLSFPRSPRGLLGVHWHACVQCITKWHRDHSYNSTLLLPDTTLNFAKNHPLMEERVEAHPLLLTKGVNFTRLAVDRVLSLDRRQYNVLFIGTGKPQEGVLCAIQTFQTHTLDPP